MKTSAWVGGLALAVCCTLPFLSCSSSDSGGNFGYGANGGAGGSGATGNSGGSKNDGSTQDHITPTDGTFIEVSAADAPQFDPDAYWANDPPPPHCLDSGIDPPTPGGTPECPDDKNRQGCPCTKKGETAPCWPGFRKNRNRGICHDGTATCMLQGETQLVWGECQGYVLPIEGAVGKEGCGCFSAGQWKITNLSPCFGSFNGGPYGSTGAASTTWNGTQSVCPQMDQSTGQFIKPTQSWSTDSLKVDCSGHFKLCYALKAGNKDNPQPTDCTLVKVCTEGDYTTPNQDQAFPDLASWVADGPSDVTCAEQFAGTSGYGEMSVIGLSVECDVVDDGKGGEKVFNRVQYCPMSCQSNPNAPECQNCMSGGSGSF